MCQALWCLVTNLVCAMTWPETDKTTCVHVICNYLDGHDLPPSWDGLALGDAQLMALTNLRSIHNKIYTLERSVDELKILMDTR